MPISLMPYIFKGTAKAPLTWPAPKMPTRVSKGVKSLRIGCDLDSVLNHLDRAWVEWVQNNHDPEFKIEKWVSWDLHKHAKGGQKLYSFLDDPKNFSILEVQEDAVRVTKKLAKYHDLFVVSTCTNFIACAAKAAWLKKYFPHISQKNIVFTARKDIIRVDVLIDDGEHNFKNFEGIPILYDSPWNTHAKHLDKNRLKGWKAIENWMIENNYLPK